jgi:hypothetical protein
MLPAKNLQDHIASIALYHMHHNFSRIRKTLRVTLRWLSVSLGTDSRSMRL